MSIGKIKNILTKLFLRKTAVVAKEKSIFLTEKFIDTVKSNIIPYVGAIIVAVIVEIVVALTVLEEILIAVMIVTETTKVIVTGISNAI